MKGLVSEEVLVACDEQIGVAEGDDEAGASQAVQMFRAFRNRNINAVGIAFNFLERFVNS